MFGNKVKRATASLNLHAATSNKNAKRKADGSPGKEIKRFALGDISNATKNENVPVAGKAKGKDAILKPVQPKLATRSSKVKDVKATTLKKENKVTKPTLKVVKPKVPTGRVTRSSSSGATLIKPEAVTGEEDVSLLYTTAIETTDSDESLTLSSTELALNSKNIKLTEEVKKALPDGVFDFDNECGDDPFQVGLYAQDIFDYYKTRELKFPVSKYLTSQTELNKGMRSILVDWLVEVQESFELNHETLYLAIKLVDLFLGKVQIKRDKLQLVGTTAFWIAAKFDERTSPSIDDFCYICDDAYTMQSIIKMEIKMLKTLQYDIGIPLSYRFLRRYARCAKLEMETLTLARYILESSLMEYEFIDVRDSLIAGAALLLALCMNGVEKPWTPTLAHYSGYSDTDLFDLANRLLNMLRTPPPQVKTIRTKYSHRIFYEVAKIPLPDEIKL